MAETPPLGPAPLVPPPVPVYQFHWNWFGCYWWCCCGGADTGENYIIENDGVTIKKVGVEDDTFFTCRARVQSTGELQDRRIKVDVIIPPTFVAEPKNASVVEGDSAVIECQANGKPDPTYKWVDRNNQDLVGRER